MADDGHEALTCDACGTGADPEARFCRRCGAPLRVADRDLDQDLTATLSLASLTAMLAGGDADDQERPAGQVATVTRDEPADDGADPAEVEPAAEAPAPVAPEPAASEPAASELAASELAASDPDETAAAAETTTAEPGEAVAEPATATQPDAALAEPAEPAEPAAPEAPADPAPTWLDPAPAEGVRACRSCGASNPSARLLCVRCGADLDTGETPPQLVPAAERVHGTRVDPLPGRRRRWWLPILAVLATVGLVLGGLALAQVGPFESEPELPQADFDPAVYAEDDATSVLVSDVASLTSAPPADGRSFDPARMLDNDLETAWRGVDADLPDEVPQTIDLILEEAAWLDGVVFAVGDQFDDESFTDVARPSRVQVTFDGGEVIVVDLLDQLELQAVALPTPRLTTTVRLEILDVVPGAEVADPAFSRVEVRGWVATPDDAQLAQERAEIQRAAGPVVLSRG